MTPASIYTTDEYGQAAPLLERFKQFMELCKQEAIMLDQASAEIDVGSICTEEVFFNLEKITERKEKLEQMCVILDESEKRLEKNRSNFMYWVLSAPNLDDQTRDKLQEDFNRAAPILGKRSFAIQKEYIIEFIELLNFLSMRYGAYQLISSNQDLSFSSEIEHKLYESYIRKIKKLFKEEQEADLLIEQRMQAVSGS